MTFATFLKSSFRKKLDPCAFPDATAEHYLFNCPLYYEIGRNTLINLPPLNCDILLFENVGFSLTFKAYDALTVREFITLSGRF